MDVSGRHMLVAGAAVAALAVVALQAQAPKSPVPDAAPPAPRLTPAAPSVPAGLERGGASTAPVASHAAPAAPDAAKFFAEYCITCHNDARKVAGLSLQGIDLTTVGRHAETGEKVAVRLRMASMPPVGMKRPQPADYKAMADALETALDRMAAATPDPGRPLTRRLTRTEYGNAIRDLLDMEIDAASLLPPDNVGYGFDNIGSILSISPVLMERYMFAADRISRRAVGETAQPSTETYRVSGRYMQTARQSEDMPLGSRGGMAVQHYFPADGEYSVQIRLQRNDDGYIRGMREAHQIDLRVDDARVQLFTIGGERFARSGPVWTGNQNVEYSGDPLQVSYEFTADDALTVRFTAKTGIRRVTASFVRRAARPTGVLAPKIAFDDLLHYKGGDPAVESIAITGPFSTTGRSETPARQRIFTCTPSAPADDVACASRILGGLARRAYRRPITAEELDDLLALYRKGQGNGGFEAGVRLGLYGLLSGPEFLFRVEQDPSGVAAGRAYRVSDLEMASRLSFFLWSTIPDEALLSLAEKGQLQRPAVLEQQVRRMLADPKAEALVTNFATQWLALKGIDAVEPDSTQFPDFDNELRDAFRQETQLLFRDLFRNDRSVLDLLTADYTFVNERLAAHYGIPGVRGERFRRVTLPAESGRAGILGHGSVLTVTSYAARTSPVLRGKWVLEQLLDTPPPAPPPDVPALEERNKDGRPMTMRQALEMHRQNPACASCHKLMDPIGFALEPFDAVGQFRTVDFRNQETIDPSGVLFDGTAFSTTSGFRQALLHYSDRFVATATRRLLTYALGRPVEYRDAPVVRKVVREAAAGGYRWSSLVLGIVRSDPFRMRRVDPS